MCVEFGSVHSSLKLLHNELPASITYSAIKSEGAVVSMLDHSYSEETCICLLDSWTGPASRLSVQTRRENSNAFVALMLRKLRSDRSICQVWNGFEVPLQKDRKKKVAQISATIKASLIWRRTGADHKADKQSALYIPQVPSDGRSRRRRA